MFLLCVVLAILSFFTIFHEHVWSMSGVIIEGSHRANQSSIPFITKTVTPQESPQSANHTLLNDTAMEVRGDKKDRLEFIHITKTGGSAIEAAASHQAKIAWGACHYRVRIPHCSMSTNWYCDLHGPNTNIPNMTYFGEPWHSPAHWQRKNPFRDAHIFVVVRNPYDRIISEYHCFFYGYKGPDSDDLNVFNQWIEDEVNLTPNRLQSHMLPQHHYAYDTNGNKIVDHVLKYENLNEEFDNLMREYGIPMTLPPKTKKTVLHTYSEKDTQTRRIFNAHDLTARNIKLINDVYHLDFEYYGYPKMLV